METLEETMAVGLADRQIKVEEELEKGDDVEGNGCNTPCESTSPDPSLNSGVFYFPTQAVLPPRSSLSFVTNPSSVQLRSMQRLSNKRRTLAALTEEIFLNADEPILFEETIAEAKVKIVVFDEKIKLEVPRETLLKEGVAVAANKPLANTVGSPKETESFPKIGSCYSLQQGNSSATQSKPGACFSTSCAKTTINAPITANISTDTRTASRTTLAVSTITPRLHHQATRVDASSITTLSTPNLLLKQSSPTSNFAGSSLNKTLIKPTAPDSLSTGHHLSNSRPAPNVCVVPCTTVRPEISNRVCSPSSASDTTRCFPTGAIYVPREINMASTELGLEQCVNVKDICDKELTKWTAEDVAKFVRATDCSEHADTFIDQEIDGKALTLLNQDLLIQWMNLKLGPAMKLYSHILNLKHALCSQP